MTRPVFRTVVLAVLLLVTVSACHDDAPGSGPPATCRDAAGVQVDCVVPEIDIDVYVPPGRRPVTVSPVRPATPPKPAPPAVRTAPKPAPPAPAPKPAPAPAPAPPKR